MNEATGQARRIMATNPSRILVWIILGLVMVGLVGFGSTNFGRSARAIGTVGATEIDANRYFRELSATLRAFQAQTGQALPIAQARSFGLTAQALERVISATALDDENARLGISIGDDRLRQAIFTTQAFLDMNTDQFSPSRYENTLLNAGLTPKEYEATLRADLARGLLRAAVAGAIAPPDSFTDTLFDFARERRDFTWGRLAPEALEEQPPEPDAAALEAWYRANPGAYTLPEVKKLTVAWLKPENLLDRVDLPAETVRREYEARAERYDIPERRLVERLVFANEAEVQAAMDAIAAGETDFAGLVAERGLDLSDVDLGDMTREALGDSGEAVFALAEPGIVGPVPTTLGPAIFRVNAILAARYTPFEQVEQELRAELGLEAARRMIGDMMGELDDLLAGGARLEELAREVPGMELVNLDWTPASAGGIAGYEAFQDRAAAAGEGDFPELELLADGGLFALRVDRLEPARLQSLDEVREQVSAAVRAEAALEALSAQARGLIERITGQGQSLEGLGIAERVETGLTRAEPVADAPPALLERVFEMEPGAWEVVPDGEQGVILVRLNRIIPADASTDEARQAKAGFSERVAQEIGLDLEAAFIRAVQERAGIRLDQAVINAVESQFP